MARKTYNPYKGGVEEIINFRGIASSENEQMLNPAFVESQNNLDILRVREMTPRTGQSSENTMDTLAGGVGGVVSGKRLRTSVAIAKGTDVYTDRISGGLLKIGVPSFIPSIVTPNASDYVRGLVYDASTGEALTTATVTLTVGSTGDVQVRSITETDNGYFNFGVVTGKNLTITVEADGYASIEDQPIVQSPDIQLFEMSAAGGEFRVELTWTTTQGWGGRWTFSSGTNVDAMITYEDVVGSPTASWWLSFANNFYMWDYVGDYSLYFISDNGYSYSHSGDDPKNYYRKNVIRDASRGTFNYIVSIYTDYDQYGGSDPDPNFNHMVLTALVYKNDVLVKTYTLSEQSGNLWNPFKIVNGEVVDVDSLSTTTNRYVVHHNANINSSFDYDIWLDGHPDYSSLNAVVDIWFTNRSGLVEHQDGGLLIEVYRSSDDQYLFTFHSWYLMVAWVTYYGAVERMMPEEQVYLKICTTGDYASDTRFYVDGGPSITYTLPPVLNGQELAIPLDVD